MPLLQQQGLTGKAVEPCWGHWYLSSLLNRAPCRTTWAKGLRFAMWVGYEKEYEECLAVGHPTYWGCGLKVHVYVYQYVRSRWRKKRQNVVQWSSAWQCIPTPSGVRNNREIDANPAFFAILITGKYTIIRRFLLYYSSNSCFLLYYSSNSLELQMISYT